MAGGAPDSLIDWRTGPYDWVVRVRPDLVPFCVEQLRVDFRSLADRLKFDFHTGPVGAAAGPREPSRDAALCGREDLHDVEPLGRVLQCGNQPVRRAGLEVLFTILAASTQRETFSRTLAPSHEAWRLDAVRSLTRTFDFRTGALPRAARARRRLGREFRGGARRVPTSRRVRVARDPAPGRVWRTRGVPYQAYPFAAPLLRNEGHLDCGYFRHTALDLFGSSRGRAGGAAVDHEQWCGEISGRISGGAALFPPVNWTRTTKTKPS